MRSVTSLIIVTALCSVLSACGSNEAAVVGDIGFAVEAIDRALDGIKTTTVDEAACTTAPSHGAHVTAGDDEFGDTLFNDEGDDDECKYHVSFSAADAADDNVTFTVHVVAKKGGAPVAGADVRAEVFLDETHVVQGGTTTEAPDGTYTVGPVAFDRSGRWTVRFHLFESCLDGETSPHAHVAFFLDVP